jgi:hypothetical protein
MYVCFYLKLVCLKEVTAHVFLKAEDTIGVISTNAFSSICPSN